MTATPTRREFLAASASAGGGLLAGGLLHPGTARAADPPLSAATLPEAAPQPLWAGLVTSLPEEHDYAPEIWGLLPAALRGSLYRNGPGLFDRGGLRKRALVDGDGMIQEYAFADGAVRYRNRFVRTRKLVEEEAAGRYLYATWTTQAPGGRFANLFGRAIRSQAGVSTAAKNGRIYAFDESAPPHELDARTLETRGEALVPPTRFYSAHGKTDGRSGDWLHFGLEYGRNVTVHLTSFRADGSLGSHRTLALPRYCYLHDWFATERWLVLNVHPAEIEIARFLFGGASLVGAMRWRPEQGNLVLVVPREGEPKPIAVETGAVWMWHALNAYERGGEIVADFVGYDAPDHFLGEDAQLFAAMSLREGAPAAPGRLRRFVIDPSARTLRSEPLAAGHAEFPIVHPRRACHEHRYAYCVRDAAGRVGFESQVARIDTRTGAEQRYDFGAGLYCGEPVFAPAPESGGADSSEPGWLLTQVYDGRARKTFLAVLDAEYVADGPVASVRLRHHVPVSFHGAWRPAV
jgi:all-trans-8'-apo-beta-carotenal 15,15'-oxygenase